MRALVIGADGFVGRHLTRHLLDAGDTVVEAVGQKANAGSDAHHIDIRDADAVASLVHDSRPDAIYHLAAVAYGPDASHDLSAAVAITVGGTANVLTAAAGEGSPPTVLIPGSSEVYGTPDVERIDESTPLRPVNVYGATKVAQEVIGLAFGRAHAFGVVATRSFNHIGPGQRDSFAVASFARQLRSIELGRSDPVLRVGNLAPIRDFSDVRDVVRAYRALVAGAHAGEPINVASGTGTSIGDVVKHLVAISGLEVTIEVDPGRVRSTDPPRIVGDPGRIGELTGWRTTIPLEETLRDVWFDAQSRTT